MDLYVLLVVVSLLVGSLAWQAGYKRGKADEERAFWRIYGDKLEALTPAAREEESNTL